MEAALKSGRIFSFISPKGGSGKTITAITLGTVLSGLGKAVLLVDADASTNGLSLFYLDKITLYKSSSSEKQLPSGTFDLSGVNEIGVVSVGERVDVAPASFVMSQTEKATPDAFRARLGAMFSKWKVNYDYIFLDAQAGTDEFAEVAVVLADEIVVVSEYDPMSVQGIERLRILFREAIGQKRVWTLFNKVLPEFVQGIGEFLAVARYLTPIPWDADVVRAYVRRGSPVDMIKGNTHTLAAMQTAESLFGNEIEASAETWRKDRVDLVRRPAVQQLADVEKLIGELEDKKVVLKYRRSNLFRQVGQILAVIVIMIGVIIIGFPNSDLSITFMKEAQRTFARLLGTEISSLSAGLLVIIIGMFAGAIFPRVLTDMFGRENEKSERARVGIDLELQKLHEERARLRTLANIDLGDIFNLGRETIT